MEQMIELEVFRYRPTEDVEPVYQRYEVPLRREWVVLDALNHIKDHLDGSLSYRWSCRMGICGSCGMVVNGEPVLTCAAFLTSYSPGPIRVDPLSNFPVVRDLVIQMDDFMEKLNRVSPWLIRRDEPAALSDGEYRQTPAQVEDYKQYSMCINCLLCYSACPVYGLEPTFLGPASIALAQRYNLDSRDQGKSLRHEVLAQEDGIWQCTFVGECSKVCPKNVDPAGAIQRYKVEAAVQWWKSILLPWSKTADKSAAT